MKYCKNCNKEFDEESNFCPFCGSVLSVPEKHVKTCSVCGKELEEETNFCPICGNPLTTPKSEIKEDANQESTPPTTQSESDNKEETKQESTPPTPQGFGAIIFFMTLSCVLGLILGCVYGSYGDYTSILTVGILPLIWKIPMTAHFYNSATTSKKLSTTFKVCTLLFVSTISGIIMLSNKDI